MRWYMHPQPPPQRPAVRAKATAATWSAPAARRAAAHAARVAPVVTTSSTSSAWRGAGTRARIGPGGPLQAGGPAAADLRLVRAGAGEAVVDGQRSRSRRDRACQQLGLVEGPGAAPGRVQRDRHQRGGQPARRRVRHHERRHLVGDPRGRVELERLDELARGAVVGHRRPHREAAQRGRRARPRKRSERRQVAHSPAPRAAGRGAGPAQRRCEEVEEHGRSVAEGALQVGTSLRQSRACRVTTRATRSCTGSPIR